MIEEAEDDATRDVLMIAAAQKCEHYEIASYGTIRVWANLLDKTEVAALFEDTLEEEKEADRRLTQIAESVVNAQAANSRGEQEDEEEENSRVRLAAHVEASPPIATEVGGSQFGRWSLVIGRWSLVGERLTTND